MAAPRPATTPGQQIYYRSIQERETDLLTTYDYLWRWDTDWFWCSGAFGAQHPRLRKVWPRKYRRSDVYYKMVGWDHRFHIADRLDKRAGRPQRERVIQDVEIPVERLPEFLDWFDAEIGMRPVWLCPLRLRSTREWPTVPAGRISTRTVRQRRLLGHRARRPRRRRTRPSNRAIEAKVHELGGHKSLYSEAFYDRETFDELVRRRAPRRRQADSTTPTTG